MYSSREQQGVQQQRAAGMYSSREQQGVQQQRTAWMYSCTAAESSMYVQLYSSRDQQKCTAEEVSISSEPVFVKVYGAQESIPRNRFRQPM